MNRRNLGVEEGANATPIFFTPNDTFFGYRVEERQIKLDTFSKR
jgi:hypothetical protein